MAHPWSKQHRLVLDPPEPWLELSDQLTKPPTEKVRRRRKKCEPVSDTKI